MKEYEIFVVTGYQKLKQAPLLFLTWYNTTAIFDLKFRNYYLYLKHLN